MPSKMSDFVIEEFIKFVKNIYGSESVPLHKPLFFKDTNKYLMECIESNFVSTAGQKVIEFERKISKFTGSKYAIATINGTSALHVGLQLANVKRNDEVITQALTFVGTCNPIVYIGAHPVFIDVDMDTLGLSPVSLRNFLQNHAVHHNGSSWNKVTGRRLAACIPMHTFGMPCRIDEITSICEEWRIPVVEDAAESLGSFFQNKHTGTFGLLGALSFNGNKIITTGGGGMIITNDESIAFRAKHITTTSKVPDTIEFIHDEIGYNYGLPNINAALGCAQIEYLRIMLEAKHTVHELYSQFFDERNIQIVRPLINSNVNNWLNAIILNDRQERDKFLRYTNSNGVVTRPVWRLISELEMYKEYQNDGLGNSLLLQDRVVNIPSSVPENLISN